MHFRTTFMFALSALVNLTKMRLIPFMMFVMLFPALAHAQVWTNTSALTKEPYYKRPGGITFHLTNHMFSGRKTAMPPMNFIAQVTVAKHFTLGPMFTYFNFRRSEPEAVNATRWINPEIKYHEMMAGLRAEYHLNSLMEKMINKRIPQHYVDVYAGVWFGRSFVKSNSAEAKQDLISGNEKFRGGVSLGARSLVLKWMGFSLEGGYSSYGYCSFGVFFVAR